MQTVEIFYDHESVDINIGGKSFRGTDDVYEYVNAFAEALEELGMNVETELVY